MRVYNPRDWFWISDDGNSIYSSKSGSRIQSTDPAFLSAKNDNGVTRWPTDESGAQTDASLNAVLITIGQSVSGAVRTVSGPTLIKALTDAQYALIKGRDQACIAGRDSLAENLDMIARAAGKAGITPKAWFDLALGVTTSTP